MFKAFFSRSQRAKLPHRIQRWSVGTTVYSSAQLYKLHMLLMKLNLTKKIY